MAAFLAQRPACFSSTSATTRRRPIGRSSVVGVRAQAPAPPAAATVATLMPMAATPLAPVAPLQLQPGQVHQMGANEVDRTIVLETQRLVVVDVMTTWCGPCKMIGPELDKMAEELGEKVVLTKMDCTTITENRRWAQAQGVKALPTFVLFKNGRRVGDMTGAKANSLRKLIEAHM